MDGPARLLAWLGDRSRSKFAADVGCSESHLSLLLQGKRRVSIDLAARISAATSGVVPMEAFAQAAEPVAECG